MGKRKVEMPLDASDEDLARLYGVTRLALGAGTFFFPNLAAKLWMGRGADESVSRVALRGLGGREAAIGFGLLTALETGASPGPWLQAGAIADLGDALGTLAQRGRLPASRWILATLIAGSSAWLSLQLASGFED
ncbi:MAG TPA: hypothetical protein VHI71_04485 [Actinomycetota bacterium]|nr:hypothetical protein [Actinomycetota bacterium]